MVIYTFSYFQIHNANPTIICMNQSIPNCMIHDTKIQQLKLYYNKAACIFIHISKITIKVQNGKLIYRDVKVVAQEQDHTYSPEI